MVNTVLLSADDQIDTNHVERKAKVLSEEEKRSNFQFKFKNSAKGICRTVFLSPIYIINISILYIIYTKGDTETRWRLY